MIKNIDDKALYELLKNGRRNKLDKKQILQTSDNQQVINLVVSGFVKRYLILNDGSIGVQITYGRGDVFPLTVVYKSLFDQKLYDGPVTFYYETMTECEIYSIDASVLLEAAQKNPKIYSDLLQEAGVHLESCVQRLENLSLKSSYNRVAHQLLFFAKNYGEPKPGGIKLLIPLTHQDLADILSLTRETVTNSIIKLRDEGLIKGSRNIVVVDTEKLQAAAFN